MTGPRSSYTFREGLTAMAANAVGVDPDLAIDAGENATSVLNSIRRAAKDRGPNRAHAVRDAQHQLRRISAYKHGELVSALQTKILALQGRGGDTEVAHVEPGEMVIPRALLTRELVDFVHREAARKGIEADRC
ncbi:MAG: hypothetical protein SFV19_06625 [Rhodospirillaceae bacterium]|nr:hypothetical protein [Rhodospirillaceae bacterium]